MKSKKNVFPRGAVFLGALVLSLFFSCDQEYYYYDYIPVFGSMEDYRAPGTIRAVTDIPVPRSQGLGKIALTPDRRFAFVNERNQGFRVADLSVPSQPRWLGFVSVPGNLDLACYEIDGKILVAADSFLDLVVLEVGLPQEEGSPPTVAVRQRINRVFPQNPWQLENPDELWPFYWEAFHQDERTDELVVGYRKELVKGSARFPWWGGGLAAESGSGAGMTGALSRFALVDLTGEGSASGNVYLYALDGADLHVYTLDTVNTGTSGNLSFQSKISVGWDLETVYHQGDFLYLGSSSAMYVYALSGLGSPSAPKEISLFPHSTARDPVVVGAAGPSGNEQLTAFVTLRGAVPESERSRSRVSPPVFWGSNELIAVDLSDPANPEELARITLENPRGLGLLDSKTLLVCDGPAGFRIIDVEKIRDESLKDPSDRFGVKDVKVNYETWDVIPGPEYQLVSGSRVLGLYRYSAGTLDETARLSW